MAEDNPIPYQSKFKELDDMSHEDLVLEIEKWRDMWTWIPEDMKFFLHGIGTMIRINLRSSQGYFGILQTVRWTIKEVEVATVAVEFDYTAGKKYTETKTIVVPFSHITHFEFIHEREESDINEAEEVANPDEPLDLDNAESLEEQIIREE